MSPLLKPLPQLLQRLFLNARNIAPRNTQLLRYLPLGERLPGVSPAVPYSVALADYLPLPFVKLLGDKFVQLLRIYAKLGFFLDIHSAGQYVRDSQRVPLAVGFQRLVYVHLRKLTFYFAEVHFYLVSYIIATETIPDMRNVAFWCGSVRVVRRKKPGYSLLCVETDDNLPDGQRLRVLQLRAGLTIREAAKMIGICRHTLMNYESERNKVKTQVFEKLECLSQTLLNSRK